MNEDLKLSLRQLTYFVAAAETGTITAAAERCRVSQSAISLGLTDLERGLGVKLMVRHRARGVTLTASGTQLLSDARILLARAEELQAAARDLGQQVAGRMVVGCYVTLGPFLVPRILAEFASAHPSLDLHIVEGTEEHLYRQLVEGSMDAALLFDLDPPPEAASLEVLYETTPYVLMAPTNPLAGQPSVSLADLARQQAITFDLPGSIHYVTSLLRSAGTVPRIRFRTTSFEMVRSLVARDLGYSLLFQRPGPNVSYEGRPLVTRPIAEPVAPIPVVLATRRGTYASRRVETFLAYCRDTFGTDTDSPVTGLSTRYSKPD